VKESDDLTKKVAGELFDNIFDPNPDWRNRTCLSDAPIENADVFERNKMDERVKQPNFMFLNVSVRAVVVWIVQYS
jgi:hypothetical protein